MRLTHSDTEQAKLEAFLRDWPLDRVKRMTLEEYTKHGSRKTFVYLLEYDGTPVGLGGGTSYKFGVYSHNPESADEEPRSTSHRRDRTHSWRASLGDTAHEAFLKVRQVLVEIIEGVRRGELLHMDNTIVGRTVARKVAYLYQDPARPTMVGYFRDDLLLAYLEDKGVATEGMDLARLHQAAIRRARPTDDLQSIGLEIYREQQVGNLEESDEDDDEQNSGDVSQLWHYTFNHNETASKGLNDLESLVRMGEINLNLEAGDLGDIPDDREKGKSEATRRIAAATGESNPRIRGLMGWMFAKQMRPGDIVFARVRENLFMCGRIAGDYRFEPARSAFRHARGIEWLSLEPRRVTWRHVAAGGSHEEARLQSKALTYLPPNWQSERMSLSEAFSEELGNLKPMRQVTATDNKPTKPTRVIFYGPPGTGKTYKTREHALRTCQVMTNEMDADTAFAGLLASGQVEFVTFHQSFDYSDFVVGYKPVTEDGAMVFRPKPGVLLRIAKRARENPDKPHLLIIDEINRGNISKIFGELITLVEPDKRETCSFALTLTLPCPCPGFLSGPDHDKFSLPANVHLLGTMNTADRSIAHIDSALRRRFDFVELPPKPELCPANVGGINVQELLTRLNKSLRAELTSDHQIGHSELMFKREDYPQGPRPEDVVEVVTRKILPQIDEWFHDNPTRKAEVLKGLVRRKSEEEPGHETTVTLLTKYTEAKIQG